MLQGVSLIWRYIQSGIIEFQSKTSAYWYRIYANGWCEQGGFLYNWSAIQSGDYTTNLNTDYVEYLGGKLFHINLPISYIDKNYFLFGKGLGFDNNPNDHCYNWVLGDSRTPDGFKACICEGDEYGNLYWEAKGFIK